MTLFTILHFSFNNNFWLTRLFQSQNKHKTSVTCHKTVSRNIVQHLLRLPCTIFCHVSKYFSGVNFIQTLTSVAAFIFAIWAFSIYTVHKSVVDSEKCRAGTMIILTLVFGIIELLSAIIGFCTCFAGIIGTKY